MLKRAGGLVILGVIILLVGSARAWGQEVPDAPSASRPVPPPPPPKPPPDEAKPDEGLPAAPEEQAKPKTEPNQPPHSAPDADKAASPPPMPPVTTVPEGSVPRDLDSHEDLPTIIRTVNMVVVPVIVKDNDGRLVGGLLAKDFSVLENGQKQKLNFFTSDPFPLSAAVIFDTGMPDVAVKKVQQTLPALQGAFSPFDEVAIYTYSGQVSRVADFGSVGQRLTAVLNEIKTYNGANNGPPVTSGPLGSQGPIINGKPIDSPVQPVNTPPKQFHVINDAILEAARDLSKQDRTRRKIIFVISDGREQGSTASYEDTLKVLLKENISVYAVAVEGGAIPVYGSLQKLHIPKVRNVNFGYGNILPKYVSATGGGTVYSETAPRDIENAYSRAIGDARNQYTLGYASRPGGVGYRQIEVRVRRPDVKVYAKDGYYPLPPAK